ncbi:MAG TPA: hypothetical protein O0X18_00255, partial [Methanocorpusculum sp.]|nr:hypothetical protein [Methanocorpusculum sp.]
HLPSRLRQQRRPLSSGRDGERRKANAMSEAAPIGASALSAFSFFFLPTHHHLTYNVQKKLQSTFVTSHRKKGLIEILLLTFFI